MGSSLNKVITLQPRTIASYTLMPESSTSHSLWFPTSTNTPNPVVNLPHHHQATLAASVIATLMSLSIIILVVCLCHHARCPSSPFPTEAWSQPLLPTPRGQRSCSNYHKLPLDHSPPARISTLL